MSASPRNQVVMYADVAGSATLFERLGDTEAIHAVERCMKRMKRSIDGYRGRTMQTAGDELLAAFETAEDACQAAIDMQQRIADLPPVSGLKLTIRIGLHAGAISEADGKLSGEALASAARIAGIAQRDQILGSSTLVEQVPKNGVITVRPMPELGTVSENGWALNLFQILWQAHQNPHPTAERLCVRYHGRAFLLDDKTPVLTLGRDLGNKLVIEDRKASRQHARIERRADGYYLVDTSTNGCFVALSGHQEHLVRRHEMLLEGSGRVCFGGSGNDPTSDHADFEHI
ncbi:adenylate/guanylate cyclase domain-containing protein [Dechloromonas sp.]|uniref:adenylate/guanylate cyclase domain-containing protein n=1 Tax=Dechloromonas sp. TaxID=1917218 RepID=UPI0012187801|nr:adenylate/guanylate cyclase domain-containing protein [Dechloromonas sp.]MBU3695145.1 adenylate/guanylate cyclase domain-containing protein [Dechloromonas sp.]TEX47651.1 MAG: adenylate/guanylate cyclase domain-containing protein [Rhodocyclaceae bacterium]